MSNLKLQVRSLSELDEAMRFIDEEYRKSDDAGRAAAGQLKYIFPDDLPKDPHSEEYLQAQLQRYKALSGNDNYTVNDEHTKFNFQEAVKRPYPFSTYSSTTISDYIIALGFLIKTMGLGKGAKVLEYGPGWGVSTQMFLQSGYEVIGIDVNQDFIDLVEQRTKEFKDSLNMQLVDMLEFEPIEKQDAIVFFEAFHHCTNHKQLLDKIKNFIKPGGAIYFAGEPILPALDFPWGVNNLGLGLWSIRKFGWMENIFTEDYFVDALLNAGFTVDKKWSTDSAVSTVYIAKKYQQPLLLQHMYIAPKYEHTWAARESDPNMNHRFTSGQSKLKLPQISERFDAIIELSNMSPKPLVIKLECGEVNQTVELKGGSGRQKVTLKNLTSNDLQISSEVWDPNKFFANGDNRKLGVAVNQIELNAARD